MGCHTQNVMYFAFFSIGVVVYTIGMASPYWNASSGVHAGLFQNCFSDGLSDCVKTEVNFDSCLDTACKLQKGWYWMAIVGLVLAGIGWLLLMAWAASSVVGCGVAGKSFAILAGLSGAASAGIYIYHWVETLELEDAPKGWSLYVHSAGALWILVQGCVGMCIADPKRTNYVY